VDDTLAAALAFDRAMRARGAERVVPLEQGLVVLHDRLSMLHHLNVLLLDAPLSPTIDARAFEALADEHLGHLGHRHVVVDDVVAAERLAPALLDAGWSRGRVVFMEWRGDRNSPPAAGEARELTDAESEPLELMILGEDAPGDGATQRALARQLLAGLMSVRAGTRSICFGAFAAAQPVSSATLFLERPAGGIAIIDEVGTLRAHRERGYARAVVVAALQAAIDQGCDPIIVPADADDWPQVIYAKLGFEPLGIQVAFTRSVGSTRS
jgi:GNAT superfamily N-acetyltransferase